GLGGGGAASKNVDIVTAFPQPQLAVHSGPPNTLPEALFNSLFGALAPQPAAQATGKATSHVVSSDEKKAAKKREKEALAKIHPGFASTRSVVLHHFGTDPKYQQWRSQMASGQFQQGISFQSGVGMVDTVTDIEAPLAPVSAVLDASNVPAIDP